MSLFKNYVSIPNMLRLTYGSSISILVHLCSFHSKFNKFRFGTIQELSPKKLFRQDSLSRLRQHSGNGLVARQRKSELQRLNEQLRQINTALRRQAKIESYAPTLSYAPVGGKISESEVIIDPKKEELISHLKNGKTFLRNQALEKAFLEFKTALELARDVKDPIEEKKAARGLGASLQRQGKYKEAIEYHSMVLDISARNGEESGSTEAYGAIADCYTELGDIERAAKYYDQYIARLQSD